MSEDDLTDVDVRAYNADRKKLRKKMIRDIVTEHKKASTCNNCGTNEDLTFHHREGEIKIGDVSHFVRTRSLAGLLKELVKCDILCRTCHDYTHRIEHMAQRRQLAWATA